MPRPLYKKGTKKTFRRIIKHYRSERNERIRTARIQRLTRDNSNIIPRCAFTDCKRQINTYINSNHFKDSRKNKRKIRREAEEKARQTERKIKKIRAEYQSKLSALLFEEDFKSSQENVVKPPQVQVSFWKHYTSKAHERAYYLRHYLMRQELKNVDKRPEKLEQLNHYNRYLPTPFIIL